MAWMETDYSKHTYFLWKTKWRLEHLGALGAMGKPLFVGHGTEYGYENTTKTTNSYDKHKYYT